MTSFSFEHVQLNISMCEYHLLTLRRKVPFSCFMNQCEYNSLGFLVYPKKGGDGARGRARLARD